MQGVGTKYGTIPEHLKVPDIFGDALDQSIFVGDAERRLPTLFRWLDRVSHDGEPLALLEPGELLNQIEHEAAHIARLSRQQEKDLSRLVWGCWHARKALESNDPAMQRTALLFFFQVGRLVERARARAVEAEVLRDRRRIDAYERKLREAAEKREAEERTLKETLNAELRELRSGAGAAWGWTTLFKHLAGNHKKRLSDVRGLVLDTAVELGYRPRKRKSFPRPRPGTT